MTRLPAPAQLNFDVLIIGSGLAGLTAALLLAPTHRVALLTKRELSDGSSGWAQGGMAAVLAEGDTLEQHVSDTLIAGAGLCDAAAVRAVVEGAPEAIAWLRALGVPFSEDSDKPGELHLTREGGHSQRRIVHATDATGAAVQRTLLEQLRRTANITVFEHHMLVDLITDRQLKREGKQCHGAHVLDVASGRVRTFSAGHTILATGGAGKVYLYSTNPDTATGDGIASAWRAGCRVSNMEFIQFHPTCLYHPHAKSFLISEAVRGEGGQLLLPPEAGGTRFMPAHDARAELAPRDVVARAIDFEMKKHGVDCVYLDISHQSPAFLQEHFPNILQRCAELGIDITSQAIPVVPAAHYTCGGVLTDLAGRTDLSGLYAIGETACTGLHGANRLASNSLVECVVLARATHDAIQAQEAAPSSQTSAAGRVTELPAWDESQVTDADEAVVISHNWDELRRFMWNYVGIVRTSKRLERAAHRIALLDAEIQEFYAHFRVTRDLLELRNLLQVADLIVRSAQGRHESRGLHFSRDYPVLAPQALPTVLAPAVA
ncbi:L-aspartate oxidase [Polaromonas sp. OV174]|uniref:L-aspartate oxidase n=1 Tax=Polaromonas sp. OV174 TaxID=1855300 RepID=UPI0008F237BE|nr:L-aspartate oxidase [Polaromonas sp. OV174]SFB68647.1 L-aspartate oxidase [Polaromonas sp. OV174]